MFLQVAPAQALGIDACLRSDHALHELLGRHLETKDGHTLGVATGSRLANRQLQRRFAHARSSRHNDQIGFIQSSQYLVQVGKTGRHANDFVATGM